MRKFISRIFLIALIVLFVVLSSYLFISNNSNHLLWRTYRDNMYGVEFKYPISWFGGGDSGLASFNSFDYFSKREYKGGDFPSRTIINGASLNIRILQQSYHYDIEKVITANKNTNSKNTIIQIEGQKALLMENIYDSGYNGKLTLFRPYDNSQLTIDFFLVTSAHDVAKYNSLLKSIAKTIATRSIDSEKATIDCYDSKKYPTEKEKSSCIEYIAGRRNDKNLCTKVSYPKDYCVYLNLVKNNDLSSCETIGIKTFMVNCFREIAKKQNKGIEICQSLGSDDSKRSCKFAFENTD